MESLHLLLHTHRDLEVTPPCFRFPLSAFPPRFMEENPVNTGLLWRVEGRANPRETIRF